LGFERVDLAPQLVNFSAHVGELAGDRLDDGFDEIITRRRIVVASARASLRRSIGTNG
jgi:hypothetical protein